MGARPSRTSAPNAKFCQPTAALNDLDAFCSFVACTWIYGGDVVKGLYRDGDDAPSFEVLHVEPQEGIKACMWAIVRFNETLVVVFRGTKWDQLESILVDLSALPIACPVDENIVVHSGMWAATHMEEPNDSAANASRTICSCLGKYLVGDSKTVVVCGHSLGGGLALITALDLMAQNVTEHVKVTTFGAPQVLAARSSPPSELWERLDTCTKSYVHPLDIVPRLPSNEACMNQLIPLMEDAAKQRIGLAGEWMLRAFLQRHKADVTIYKQITAAYRPVGTILSWTTDKVTADDLHTGAAPPITNYEEALQAHRCYRLINNTISGGGVLKQWSAASFAARRRALQAIEDGHGARMYERCRDVVWQPREI